MLDGVTEQADVIVANILAEVIVRFTEDAASLLKKAAILLHRESFNQKREEVKKLHLTSWI